MIGTIFHSTAFQVPNGREPPAEAGSMFEVYLNDKRDLLVIEKGAPVPLSSVLGRWRKKKRAVRVSDAIKSAVRTQGYYLRKLKDQNGGGASDNG